MQISRRKHSEMMKQAPRRTHYQVIDLESREVEQQVPIPATNKAERRIEEEEDDEFKPEFDMTDFDLSDGDDRECQGSWVWELNYEDLADELEPRDQDSQFSHQRQSDKIL